MISCEGMPQPKFYNSLTKRIEVLRPKQTPVVRIYNCGPTVYKRQHLGNLRRYLFTDFLRRSLEWQAYEVEEIVNITDVGHLTEDDLDEGEDKLENEARARQMAPSEIADEQIKLFRADLAALNIQPAQVYPRATEHVPQMIELIQRLLANGHAYLTTSGVYYDVNSWPAYGKLSGNTLEKVASGRRVPAREEKRAAVDFALWKINDPKHVQQWDSPWGRGYPGWHVECSAMSRHYLGGEIDIHTGGEDNMFPHHENEIAQSEGAFAEPLARLWLHNRHLRLKGAKLAKRTGEAITLETLRDKGFSPLSFRLLVFGSHYRKPLDFSWESLAAAEQNLEAWRQLLRRLEEGKESKEAGGTADKKLLTAWREALTEDLNTSEALASLHEWVRATNQHLDQRQDVKREEIWSTLQEIDKVLGVFTELRREIEEEKIPAEAKQLAEEREQARKAGKFERADALRQSLAEQGFVVEDTVTGPRLKRSVY
jgi:cysteinyl-tRNA synthetase